MRLGFAASREGDLWKLYIFANILVIFCLYGSIDENPRFPGETRGIMQVQWNTRGLYANPLKIKGMDAKGIYKYYVLLLVCDVLMRCYCQGSSKACSRHVLVGLF